MIIGCINPQCTARRDLFGAGALYALQADKTTHAPHRKEFMWLCVSCAARSTIQADAEGNLIVVSKSGKLHVLRTAGDSEIRLVFSSTRVPLPTKGNMWRQGKGSKAHW